MPLAEFKSTSQMKSEHLDPRDPGIRNLGCSDVVEEMHLIHVDRGYVRGWTGIDWFTYFKREDVTAKVRELLPTLPQRVADMHAILAMPNGREIRPSSHCFLLYQSEFWNRCTANKPPITDELDHSNPAPQLDADGSSRSTTYVGISARRSTAARR